MHVSHLQVCEYKTYCSRIQLSITMQNVPLQEKKHIVLRRLTFTHQAHVHTTLYKYNVHTLYVRTFCKNYVQSIQEICKSKTLRSVCVGFFKYSRCSTDYNLHPCKNKVNKKTSTIEFRTEFIDRHF